MTSPPLAKRSGHFLIDTKPLDAAMQLRRDDLLLGYQSRDVRSSFAAERLQ